MLHAGTKQPVTLASLIKKNLKEAYYLPTWPSSYSSEKRFYNDTKYQVFDCPPCSKVYSDCIYPCRNLPTAGNDVPVLSDYNPPSFLKDHWTKWLPDFPAADIRPVNEGLQDDIPIVTNTATQGIPKNKHSVDPDDIYRVQSKSAIPDTGAPCPRYFLEEDSISFPCMVKVDLSWSGQGNRVANNKDELYAIIKDIRDEGWTGNITYQELIEDINEVLSFQFYLHASKEIYWVGTILSGFEDFRWTNGVADWDRQDEYKDLFYDQFVIPVADYLHKRGYFGIVMCEVLMCDHGKYLVDLNPRVSADTTHLLIADYLAQFGFKHSIVKQGNTINKSAKTLVEIADHINISTSSGMVIIVAAADVEENRSEYEVSVFAKSPEEVLRLHAKIICS